MRIDRRRAECRSPTTPDDRIIARPPTRLFRLVGFAYRRGIVPKRGTGKLFDRTPAALWGGDVLSARTDAGVMTLPLREHGARQLLVFGGILLERDEARVAIRLFSLCDTFVDIGASYGFYSVLAASSDRPPKSIISIEPNPEVCKYLRANLTKYDVLEAMIGDISGQASLHVAANSVYSSATRAVGRATTVKVMTLDEVMRDRGVQPDFVKCDVEGGEMAVLRGARELRRGRAAPIWMLEVDSVIQSESGSSVRILEEELLATSGGRFYVATRAGGLVGLGSLAEAAARGKRNVFFVPPCRYNVAEWISRST